MGGNKYNDEADMPIVPTLNKDKLLTSEEALETMKDKPFHPALRKLVEENRVRVWLCEDGKLRFQQNPYPCNGPVTNKRDKHA